MCLVVQCVDYCNTCRYTQTHRSNEMIKIIENHSSNIFASLRISEPLVSSNLTFRPLPHTALEIILSNWRRIHLGMTIWCDAWRISVVCYNRWLKDSDFVYLWIPCCITSSTTFSRLHGEFMEVCFRQAATQGVESASLNGTRSPMVSQWYPHWIGLRNISTGNHGFYVFLPWNIMKYKGFRPKFSIIQV